LRKIKNICQQIRKISSAKAKTQYQQQISLGDKVADKISATEFVVIQNNVMVMEKKKLEYQKKQNPFF
jgi:hypothetical protein